MGDTRLDVINSHLWKKTSASIREYPEVFQYSMSDGGGLLTKEQRRFYDENGFIVVPNLISNQVLDSCKQRFVDLCEGKIHKGNITLMKDVSVAKSKDPPKGEALYYKAQDIMYDEVFQNYFTSSKLLDLVECFVGPNVMGMHSMLINKPPDTGTQSSRHPLHQDLYYFPFRPADHIVAAWTAMEHVDESNGCLFVLPGTHKGVLLQHEYPNWEGGVNKAFHGIPFKDDHPKTFLPMEKGETVFFHPLLIHGSGYNTTKGYRKAISCHFASSDCYYIDVTGTIQESVAKEIEGMAKMRGITLDIVGVWKYRCKLLRGRSGTL